MSQHDIDTLQMKYTENMINAIKDISIVKDEKIWNKLEEIHAQTIRTNGRVTKLEALDKENKKKLILFYLMAEYPKITTSIVLFILAFLISDLRHPVMRYLGIDIG